MTGQPLQISFARAMRCSRACPRSARGWKNMSLFLPPHEPSRCQSQVSDTGPGSLDMSTIGPLLQMSRLGVQLRGTQLVRSANHEEPDWCIGSERGHDDRVRTAVGRAVAVARPIWSGAINFGLVTIPVELYSATEDHTISFRQFERGASDRIRYKRINERPRTGVAFPDIVKGADRGGGEYVIIEPDALDAIAPGRSRTIDINTFVDLDDIDPIPFQI